MVGNSDHFKFMHCDRRFFFLASDFFLEIQSSRGFVNRDQLSVFITNLIQVRLVYWLAEPLWTDPSLKSGISVQELISTKKKKKKKRKRRQGMSSQTFSSNPCK